MRSSFPTYREYQTAVESMVQDALKYVNLQDFKINGQPTNLIPILKREDSPNASLPYVEVSLGNIALGHDSENSGQNPIGQFNYSNFGNGTKKIKKTNSWYERLEFEISSFCARKDELLEISHALRRYFGPKTIVVIKKNDVVFSVPVTLDDIIIGKDADSSTGNPKNFFSSWKLTLFIEMDKDSDQKIVYSIQSIEYAYSGSFNTGSV